MHHVSDEDVDSEAPRDARARVHFRIQEPLRLKLEEAGEALGLESVSLAARHFMMLGLQASLAQIASARTVSPLEQMVAAMHEANMQAAGLSAAVDRHAAAEAAAEAASSILDTKATSPDGKRGPKG
jgi:hypothetical protein